MNWVLVICAGYVLGRLVSYLFGSLAKYTILHWIEQSAAFRVAVRRHLMREKRVKATLVGPWATKE